MAATLASVLQDREEVTCPICARSLFVRPIAEGKARFEGCGRNCLPVYWVPEDSLILGPGGGLMFVYRKKWRPDEPHPTLVPRGASMPTS